MRTLFLGPLLAFLTACSDDGANTSPGTGSTGTTSSPTTAPETGTTDDPTTTTGVPQPTAPTSSDTTTAGNTTDETTTTATTDTTSDTTGALTSSTSQTSTTDVNTTDISTTDVNTTDADTTTGATSPLTIAIVDAYLYSDCNGMVDSTHGDWYVEFDNTNNPEATSAVVVSASLSLLEANPPMLEPITVSPIASGPIAAGEYLSQGMTKLQGLSHSACEHCGEFYLLVLEYDEGGVTHIVDEEVTIQCGR